MAKSGRAVAQSLSSACLCIVGLMATPAVLAGDCYNNANAHPWCWRFRAYGDGFHGGSIAYFLVPVGICNQAGSGKIRYYLEPNPEDWFRLSSSNVDFQVGWMCGNYSAQDAVNYVKIDVNGDTDGYQTTYVCAPTQLDGVPVIAYDDQEGSCPNFGGPQSSTTPCPVSGFNVALMAFSVELNNDYGTYQVWPDTLRLHWWIGPVAPSEPGRRYLAATFIDRNVRPLLRLSGAQSSCSPKGWPAAEEVLQAVLCALGGCGGPPRVPNTAQPAQKPRPATSS